jgi:UDP-N-acetylmuramate dehydrogenase
VFPRYSLGILSVFSRFSGVGHGQGFKRKIWHITICYMDIYERLRKEIRGEAKGKEPLARYTSYQIGGPADILVFPKDQEDVLKVLEITRESGEPLWVMGGGTNLLILDRGIRGVVMNLSRYLPDTIEEAEHGTVLKAYAGMKMVHLAAAAMQRNLTGLEFTAGIPGTVGGGVVMNAGSFGSEMKDVLVSTTIVTKEGELKTLERAGLKMGYRETSLPDGSTVLEAVVRLKRGDREIIRKTVVAFNRKRKEAQPLDMPSAGSVFRNPETTVNPLNGSTTAVKARELIEKVGLLGYRVGGAQVSTKHGNFIVNTGGARAADVMAVIQEIQERVFKQFGVVLRMEVKIVGDA